MPSDLGPSPPPAPPAGDGKQYTWEAQPLCDSGLSEMLRQHKEFCSKPQLDFLSSRIAQNPGTHFNLNCPFRERSKPVKLEGRGGRGANSLILNL